MNKQTLGRYRERWQRQLAQARLYWNGLALREQRLLSGAAVVLGGLLVWLLLIEPALKKIDYWQAEIPKLRSQAEALEVLLHEAGGPRGGDTGQDLEQSLRQTLDAAGLQGVYQLQASGEGDAAAWHLSFQEAPADAVVGWLLGNPRQFSLEVMEARLQRAGPADIDGTAGKLSGTVRMDQALGAKEAS
ncbi:type II secretion system protein GspM [Pseudomonas chlororaphis]|uniref:General secretion pathway protein GspM n=1 Tax=Pseudomonas chlororaphis TaxID=587753 RepID=A0A1Q8EQH5_9PSED|nr:type II secretion system protein GspM [Pseudomonas chlororaphis]OLF54039.1 general secretion pathway protein GspM [Pseudomonas chlororaphis]